MQAQFWCHPDLVVDLITHPRAQGSLVRANGGLPRDKVVALNEAAEHVLIRMGWESRMVELNHIKPEMNNEP